MLLSKIERTPPVFIHATLRYAVKLKTEPQSSMTKVFSATKSDDIEERHPIASPCFFSTASKRDNILDR